MKSFLTDSVRGILPRGDYVRGFCPGGLCPGFLELLKMTLGDVENELSNSPSSKIDTWIPK